MTSSNPLVRGAGALALSLVIAAGIVATTPAPAWANCGPHQPWPNCKKTTEEKPAEPGDTEPGVIASFLEFVRDLLAG